MSQQGRFEYVDLARFSRPIWSVWDAHKKRDDDVVPDIGENTGMVKAMAQCQGA